MSQENDIIRLCFSVLNEYDSNINCLSIFIYLFFNFKRIKQIDNGALRTPQYFPRGHYRKFPKFV